jgi:hypothetical protein
MPKDPSKKRRDAAKKVKTAKLKSNAAKLSKVNMSKVNSDMMDGSKRTLSRSFSKGGKVKKEKEPLKNKVKRKISQVKNRKVEKAFKRTRNTDLQDKPRSGNSGVYNKGGFIQFD